MTVQEQEARLIALVRKAVKETRRSYSEILETDKAMKMHFLKWHLVSYRNLLELTERRVDALEPVEDDAYAREISEALDKGGGALPPLPFPELRLV